MLFLSAHFALDAFPAYALAWETLALWGPSEPGDHPWLDLTNSEAFDNVRDSLPEVADARNDFLFAADLDDDEAARRTQDDARTFNAQCSIGAADANWRVGVEERERVIAMVPPGSQLAPWAGRRFADLRNPFAPLLDLMSLGYLIEHVNNDRVLLLAPLG